MTIQTATRERPILFSSDMIRAILAERKCQTRRLAKPPKKAVFLPDDVWKNDADEPGTAYLDDESGRLRISCPLGQPGDHLWVRETWAIEDESKLKLTEWEGGRNPDWIYYRDAIHERTGLRWRPPLSMPRWASRITLEITGVRIERLQQITLEDAIAEGIPEYGHEFRDDMTEYELDVWRNRKTVENFAALWDSINRKTVPWESDPFVWVISFQRIKP